MKPTIEEIEAILDGKEVDIEILPTGEIREKNMHPYDNVVKLLEKVRNETHKYCSLQVNVYDHRMDIEYQLYLEDGWIGEMFSHKEVATLDEAVEFLEDFLRHRVSRGVLFKRF